MYKMDQLSPTHCPATGVVHQLLFPRRFFPVLFVCIGFTAMAQDQGRLSLSEAVQKGWAGYQSLQARANVLNASRAQVENIKNQYLPDINVALQQDYGTINGQFGPSAGVPGIASAGPGFSKQSWNAAFGAVYLLNTNWEFISFGRLRSRINAGKEQVKLDSLNLLQEQFIHGVKIAGTYLNLLAAQQFIANAQANIDRVSYIRQSVLARAKSGLVAGVDSSISNADVSSARLVYLQAVANEQRISNQLAQLLNSPPASLLLDTSFLHRTPDIYTTSFPTENNPQVKFFAQRIRQSRSLETLYRKSIYPGLNLFGTFQSRGSGFDYNYTPDFTDRYSKSYLDGINPSRYNYLLGIGISWNLVSGYKIKQQVKAQSYLSAAYQNEYDLIDTQLKDQLILADQQIENSRRSIEEAPRQLQAAQDAYLQKSVLYKNGLANIVDVQQALFALNRAQTDISVAYINTWQALLLKAAASGDFDLFMKQVK